MHSHIHTHKVQKNRRTQGPKRNSILFRILFRTSRRHFYGVATVSRIDQIIGLFCRISSLLQGSFAKETYDFIDPTNQSHPILNKSHVFICSVFLYLFCIFFFVLNFFISFIFLYLFYMFLFVSYFFICIVFLSLFCISFFVSYFLNCFMFLYVFHISLFVFFFFICILFLYFFYISFICFICHAIKS